MQFHEPHKESIASLTHHGGDLNAARRRFPLAPEPWLDLSTGINPCPYPIGNLPVEAWTRLPDPTEATRLEAAAACAYCAAREAVVAAPGAQALIQWLPRLLPARHVGVLGATYGEYRAVYQRAGATVEKVETAEALAGFDVAVLANPNNPDGRLIAPPTLAALAREMAGAGRTLVVDEAFIDVIAPEASLAPLAPEGALILRSFGKAYGLAGVRLGFLIAPPTQAAIWREALGPWAVSGPALAIGAKALADGEWLARARLRLAADRDRLDAMLEAAGFAVLGGTPLFRLARHARARAWFEHFGRAGILTRPFAQHPDRLRFGLPHAAADWARILAALTDGAGNPLLGIEH